jgi:hypothetical protein
MKKNLNKRLIWHLETTNFFTEEQCGFRRNHYTLDTLVKLYTDISNAKNSKQYLCLIALYIEKAYNMTWRYQILEIIQRANINGKMFLFLRNFPSNRTIQVKAHNEISKIYPTKNGIPQESVISVTMFLISINDIFSKIPNTTRHIMFADDCYIYCNGNNIETTLNIFQSSLNTIQNWSKETGFKFSSTKSQCVVFNYKFKINQHLSLYNTPIPIQKTIKILGIIFDDNLKWTTHLK